jgi:YVTN family beta-propeller protein
MAGVTHVCTNIAVGDAPEAVAVNSVTNKIYVANMGGDTVSKIDGPTRAVTSLPVGDEPDALAVNATTDKVYVANYNDSTVTVI